MSNDIVARNLEPELDKADAEVRDHEIPDVPEPEQVTERDEDLQELDERDLDLDLVSEDSDDGSDEDFDPGVPDSPGTNAMIREVILRDMKANKKGI
jgi:hypothetical protein